MNIGAFIIARAAAAKEMGALFIDAYYEAKSCKRATMNILRALRRRSQTCCNEYKKIVNIITLFLIGNVKNEPDINNRCDELVVCQTY